MICYVICQTRLIGRNLDLTPSLRWIEGWRDLLIGPRSRMSSRITSETIENAKVCLSQLQDLTAGMNAFARLRIKILHADKRPHSEHFYRQSKSETKPL
ncbi:hypothetical protein TcWFU_004066 [Taenia crassiceps]|uniref:Uncharacterized protein n=1 Tax=Taenia crassiceps TaxID=6207 RepID=A0ABR4QQE2_9CEST